ncbi:hypothetical protein HELRODRAFT_182049 [Helobdella robusta]|uniref:Tetraspanin n=1 Tax=Helobdella robusta TaxID=6412 RepID=T1FHN3_HELRO|nr:hypothetical protein HELRODRAFT_182049 [Helobdella robusta]ESN91871.1 hypothetical protein HELRODRAFT_182049 [Helobdella robusta]
MVKIYTPPSPFKWRLLSLGFTIAFLSTILLIYYHRTWHSQNQSHYFLELSAKYELTNFSSGLKFLCCVSAATCVVAIAVNFMAEQLDMWDVFKDGVKSYGHLFGYQVLALVLATGFCYAVNSKVRNESYPDIYATWGNVSANQHNLPTLQNLQQTYKCCGFESLDEWKRINWWRDDDEREDNLSQVPKSCCVDQICPRTLYIWNSTQVHKSSCSTFILSDITTEVRNNFQAMLCLTGLHLLLLGSFLFLFISRGDEWRDFEDNEDRIEELHAVREVATEQEAKKHKRKGSYMFVEETTETASVVTEKLEADPLIKKLPPGYMKQFNISNRSTGARTLGLSARMNDFGSVGGLALSDKFSEISLLSSHISHASERKDRVNEKHKKPLRK